MPGLVLSCENKTLENLIAEESSCMRMQPLSTGMMSNGEGPANFIPYAATRYLMKTFISE